jgi:hypothetical protein
MRSRLPVVKSGEALVENREAALRSRLGRRDLRPNRFEIDMDWSFTAIFSWLEAKGRRTVEGWTARRLAWEGTFGRESAARAE